MYALAEPQTTPATNTRPLEEEPRPLDLTEIGIKEGASKDVAEVRVFHPLPPKDDLRGFGKLRGYASTRLQRDRHPGTHSLAEELEVRGTLEMPVRFSSGMAGRGLLCKCFSGRYLSATIRINMSGSGRTRYSTHCSPRSIDAPRECNLPGAGKTNLDCKFRPKATRPLEPGDGFLFPIKVISELLYETMGFESRQDRLPPGVIVLAGGTGTGKSQIVRGLIYLFLRAKLASLEGRTSCVRPHLLTIENPIEEYLFETKDGKPTGPDGVQKAYDIDYTPRQIPQDTPNLRQALMGDALRQTPFLVYVGEVRAPADLRTVLDFAETGHCVITTMHAGTVREALQRLLTAMKARTESDQGQIAQRIHAVIHLDSLEVRLADTWQVVAPALWLGSPTGRSSLVADGPSSILPHNTEGAYSLGRQWMLKALWEKLRAAHTENGANLPEHVPDYLLRDAIEKDLHIAAASVR